MYMNIMLKNAQLEFGAKGEDKFDRYLRSYIHMVIKIFYHLLEREYVMVIKDGT
jgi:hypothetical protein